jgi:hypothetical protein
LFKYEPDLWKIKLIDVTTQPLDFRIDVRRLLGAFFGDAFIDKDEEKSIIRIAENIRSSGQKWLCMLDSAELLEEKAGVALRRFLSQIYNRLSDQGNNRLTFVAASRRLHREWRGVIPSPRFSFLTLTELELAAIESSLRDAVQQKGYKFNQAWFQENAERLYHTTEGLPALLTLYVNWIQQTQFLEVHRIEDSDIFDQIARPYVQDRLLSAYCLIPFGGTHLAERKGILESVLLKLSPYRLLTRSHLEYVCKDDTSMRRSLDALGWTVNELWEAIRETHLTAPKPELWREVYRPIRRLLFRYTFPSISEQRKVHQSAAEFYTTWWKEDLSLDIQSVLALEYLWHCTEDLRLSNLPNVAGELIRMTKELLILISPSDRFGEDIILGYLEDRLNEDVELQDSLVKIKKNLANTLIELIHNKEWKVQ